MELKTILAIMWQRKWWALQAFAVVLGVAIAAAYLLPRIYKATARLLIRASEAQTAVMSDMHFPEPGTTIDDAEVSTRATLAVVQPSLQALIFNLQIRDNNGELRLPADLLSSLPVVSSILPKPYIDAAQDESTHLVKIDVTSPDPDEAAMVANKVAEIYITEDLKERRKEYQLARQFIEGKIAATRSDYVGVLEELRQCKLDQETVDLTTETTVAINQLAELMKGKEDKVSELAKTKASVEILRRQMEAEKETSVSGAAQIENPEIGSLKKTLSDLSTELSGTLAEKAADHPDVLVLKEKIASVKTALNAELGAYRDSSTALREVEVSLAATEAEIRSTDRDIAGHRALIRELPVKSFAMTQLLLKYDVSQTLYSSLLQNLYQVGLAEAMVVSDVQFPETAAVPDVDKQDSPSKIIYCLVGFFLACVAMVCVPLLVDYLDETIKTSEEAEKAGLAILGVVPKLSRRDQRIVVNRDPSSPISEAYRTIRNSIRYVSVDRAIKTLLVTSPLKSEGKSTTLVNIGISMAQEGKRVLLIDTDLRRPRLHVLFQRPNSAGVTSVLLGESSPESAIQPTGVSGLSVLTSGPIPANPAGLIESSKLRELVQTLAAQFDIVLLDSPPVLAVPDAMVLAGMSDACLSVLELKRETRRTLGMEQALLKQAGIKPIGVVLNKYRSSSGPDYGSYYGTYYRATKPRFRFMRKS